MTNFSKSKNLSLTVLLLGVSSYTAVAQSAEVSKAMAVADTTLRSVATGFLNLMMVIGAILAIIGGLKAFHSIQSHKNGQDDAGGAVTGWILGAVFLLAVPYLVKNFFLNQVVN